MIKRLTAVLALALACLFSSQAYAATGGQLANGRQQFINASGAPLASGTVSVYAANTLNQVSTYQDPNLTVANTNPIILDSNGMASIWVAPGTYHEVVQDSSGNVLWDTTTTSVGTSAAALSPGATIGTNGDVICTATQFTGASNITLPCQINTNAVQNSDLSQMAANTIKGNNTGGTANAVDLTVAQASAMLAASGAQVKAGTSNGVLISPAAFVAAGQNTTVNCGASCTGGYVTLPGGLIEQWLHYTPGGVSTNTAYAVSFPIAFPTSCDSVIVTVDGNGLTSPVYGPVVTSGPSTSSVTVTLRGYSNVGQSNVTGFWVYAIGH